MKPIVRADSPSPSQTVDEGPATPSPADSVERDVAVCGNSTESDLVPATEIVVEDQPELSPNIASTNGGGRRTGDFVAFWLEGVAYLALAIWSTWPLSAYATTTLPTGTENVATVPLFNLWTIWWNADRLSHGLSGYWDAPIFYPVRGAFAFSEPQPTHFLVAPIYWVTGRLALAYNVYLLTSLTLNGWSASRLLQFWGSPRLPARLSGAMLLLLPFVHWQLGVLQLVPLFAFVWCFYCATALAQAPTWRWGIRLGASFGLAYFLCANYGLFFTLPFALSFLPLVSIPLFRNRRFWIGIGLAVMTATFLLLPVILPQRTAISREKFDRPLTWMTDLSAYPVDYYTPPWPDRIVSTGWGHPERKQWWRLGIGSLKTLLAGVGLLALVFPPWGGTAGPDDNRQQISPRRLVLGLTLLGFLAFHLSQGPHAFPDDARNRTALRQVIDEWPHIGPMLYRLCIQYLPGFGQVRNVFRFAVFVQMAMILLAGIGLALLGRGLRALFGRWSPRGAPVVAAMIVCVTGLAATLEVVPPRQPLYALPEAGPQSNWLAAVDMLPPEAVVACLPFAADRSVESYLSTTVWMYWQTFHRRPVLNGYSGYFPQGYLDLRDLTDSFPNVDCYRKMRDMGATHLLVHRSVAAPSKLVGSDVARKYLRHLATDEGALVDLYELFPSDVRREAE